jgi:hypothetical protein
LDRSSPLGAVAYASTIDEIAAHRNDTNDCSFVSLLQVHTKSFLAVNVFPSCSTRSSPSVIWQTIKVNFAILLLREAAELVQASPKATSTRRPRYLRRPIERDE